MAYREKFYQETNNILFEVWTDHEIISEGGIIEYSKERPLTQRRG